MTKTDTQKRTRRSLGEDKRLKVNLTLTKETLERLKEIEDQMGMSTSYAISLCINNYYIKEIKGVIDEEN